MSSWVKHLLLLAAVCASMGALLTASPAQAQQPVANPDAYAVDEDTPLSVAAPGVLGNDTDPEGQPLTAELVAAPASGTLSLSPNGSFSYTPAAGFSGTTTFTYRALDNSTPANASAAATVTITVNAVNDAPTAAADSYTTNEDTPLSVAAPGVLGNDSDPESQPLTAQLVAGPASGSLSLNPNGSFSFSPAAGFSGTTSFTYRAVDNGTPAASSAPATVTITVNAVNDAPTAAADSYTTNESTPLAVSAPGVLGNDSDPESQPLTAQLVAGPANGSLSLNPNGSFSFTPAAGFSGTTSFTYRAVDNGTPPASSAPATVTITVNAVNDPPTAAADSYTTNENTPLSVSAPGVLGNDSDPESQPLTAQLVASPASGSLSLNPNGSFSFTPATGFSGTVSFTYRAVDNGTPVGSSAPATVTITVNAVNDPPTAAADSYTTNENTPLVVAAPGVLSNDTDPESQPLTAQLVAGPASGTLLLGANGGFTFTPAVGFSGTVSFTYRAVDNGTPAAQSTPATVTITVTNVNDAPVAVPDVYTATEDTALNIAAPGVLANDTDPDSGQTLSAELVAGPPTTQGTVTLNANGSFTFQPAANFNGTTSFTYNARDNATPPAVSAAPATVTITVNADNDPPTAAADSYTTNENAPLTIAAPGVLSNDTDPEGHPLTAQLVAGPASGTLALNPNGSFSFSPAPSFSGTVTFTYRAVDGGTPPAQSAPATVTITVNNLPDPPVATPDSYTLNEDTTLVVAAPGVLGNDTDPDVGTVLNASLVAPPAHGRLTLNANGSFTFAPDVDYNGPDSFRYRARDNGTPPLQSAETTVTLNITSANDPPRFAPGVTEIPRQTATQNVPLIPLALATFFVDPENTPLTFAVTGLPPGVSATPQGVISGTPPLAATTGIFTVTVTVSDGQSQFVTTFTLVVLEAGRTDLALTATAAPSPALINQPIAWTFTVENRSPVENVANIALQVSFVAPAAFAVTPSPGCVATPQPDRTTVACSGGPVVANGRATITVNGTSAQPGDIVATATVSIVDPVPVEAMPLNDTATFVVNVAQTVPAGPAQALPVTGHRGAAAGDLDGDTFADLVVATETGTVVYPNVADPSTPGGAKRALAAQPLPLDSGPSTDVALADVDGDGALDVVIAKTTGPSSVLRNPRDGTFAFVPSPAVLGAASDAMRSVAVSDLDGDGDVDIVLGGTGQSRVFRNLGAGTFVAAGTLGTNDTRDTVTADLSGDAALEIVLANANGPATVYALNRATGEYSALPALATTGATALAAGDLDGNSRIDLVLGTAQSKVVLFNATPPGGTLLLTPVAFAVSPSADVLTTDTDFDGDLDIVGINTSGGHQIYSNNGVGTFTPRPQQFGSTAPRRGVAAKLSVDDRVDVAVVGDSSLEVFYNDGAGNLGRGDTGAPVIQLSGQASIDLTVEAPYTDAGATASDAVDGDVTSRIRVDNPVNTAVVGTYTVTYNVTDTSGNAAAPVTRTVRVGVRSGTGGGGGGAFDVVALLALATLALARAALHRSAHVRARRRRTAQRPLLLVAALLGALTAAAPAWGQAPIAVNDAYTTNEDATLTRATNTGVRANDNGNGQALSTLTVVNYSTPANGRLTSADPTGAFTYVPNANFNGTDTFTYQLRDRFLRLSNVATVTITVAAVNDAPTGVVARTFPGSEDTPLTIAAPGLLAGVSDVDAGQTITAQLVGSASNGTVAVSPTGGFTFTPAANFVGTASFSYRAVDNGTPPAATAAATVTITVANVNDPPVASPNTFAATEDTTLNVAAPGVLGNDTDPDPGTTLTAVLAAAPSRGTLTLNPNGSFAYVPAADYQGQDSFTYRARDNGNPPLESSAATVTINVAAVNDAPRFAPGVTALPSRTATQGMPVTPFSLAPYFVDPEGSPLTFAVSGLPTGVTATAAGEIGGAPALSVTPNAFTVAVTVNDGQRQFATSFTLTVLAAGRTDLALSGSATPNPALINQPIEWSFVVENRSPVENVANISVQMDFVAPASFAVTPRPGCTATPQSDRTRITCTAGPVPASGRATVVVSASSAQPGDVLATATVSITDPVPIESAPENNTATVVASVAQTVPAGPAQTLSVTGHRASAAGDFNGDGFIDLAVVADTGGTLIYPNIVDPSTPGGTKRVLAAQPITVGDASAGSDIAAADIDGDGALDLVVARAAGPSVVLRNPRDGTFALVAAGTPLGAAGDATRSVAARDLNGDGRIDVVLGNRGASRVFLNNANGTFTAAGTLGSGTDDTRDAVAVDLAGDAALEIVLASSNRGATVYSFNRATSSYGSPNVIATAPATAVAAGDFDLNGRADLVLGGPQSKVVLFNSTPPGAALQVAARDLGLSPTADILVVDSDADADADIVGINTSGSHQIYTNNGVGQFTPRAQQFASAEPRHAVAARLSVDDRVDVAVLGASNLQVFYNDGAGNLGRGDMGAPTIALNGQGSVELTVESPYTDAGATATDSVDGDLTSRVRVDNPVNTSVVGTYTVTYNVSDTSGNAATPVTRTVRVGVRSGTGGGGGGAVDLIILLALGVLSLASIIRRRATPRNAQ